MYGFVALLFTSLFTGIASSGGFSMASTPNAQTALHETQATHPYVGMWVTEDGHVRHELLPNNRYDEARGDRESAYQGRYEVTGDHIEYWDDTGFTADGDFRDDVLYHGGMVLYRQQVEP